MIRRATAVIGAALLACGCGTGDDASTSTIKHPPVTSPPKAPLDLDLHVARSDDGSADRRVTLELVSHVSLRRLLVTTEHVVDADVQSPVPGALATISPGQHVKIVCDARARSPDASFDLVIQFNGSARQTIRVALDQPAPTQDGRSIDQNGTTTPAPVQVDAARPVVMPDGERMILQPNPSAAPVVPPAAPTPKP